MCKTASTIARIAREAGDILQNRFQPDRKVLIDLPRDVKLEADYFLDAFIREKLVQESDYPILSEESVNCDTAINTTDYQWIVDPLDGSLNFSKGIPICCISIALWRGMNPVLGVIYDFNRNEMFTGLSRYGAFVNGSKIHVGSARRREQAVICTGFPPCTDFTSESFQTLLTSFRLYKKVRLFGTAAISLAYVACGRADAYYEKDIAIWDVAGGLPIVQAAGGYVFIEPSEKRNRLTVRAAANRELLSDDDA